MVLGHVVDPIRTGSGPCRMPIILLLPRVRMHGYMYGYIYLVYLVQVYIDPLPYVYEVVTNLAVPAQPTSGLMNVHN